MKKFLSFIIVIIGGIVLSACSKNAQYNYSNDSIKLSYNDNDWELSSDKRTPEGLWTICLYPKDNSSRTDKQIDYILINYSKTMLQSFDNYKKNIMDYHKDAELLESKLDNGDMLQTITYKTDYATNKIIYKNTNNGDLIYFVSASNDNVLKDSEEIVNNSKITYDFSKEYLEGYDFLGKTNFKDSKYNTNTYIVANGHNIVKKDFISSSSAELAINHKIEKYNDISLENILKENSSNFINSYQDEIATLNTNKAKPVVDNNVAYNIIIYNNSEGIDKKTFLIRIEKLNGSNYLITEIVANNLNNESNTLTKNIFMELQKVYDIK